MTRAEMFAYDFLVETGVATADEINLVRAIAFGSWMDIINAVVYTRCGYKTFDQFYDAIMEEE